MRWSQLKKRIEANFAEKVDGRLEIWQTRFRKAHDQEGEFWITIDGKRVFSSGSETYLKQLGSIVTEAHSAGASWAEAYTEAWPIMNHSGLFLLEKINRDLFESLNLSIEEIINHKNPIVRALGMIDRRFGMRRLKQFDPSAETELVKLLFHFRCEIEGFLPERKSHP